MRGSRVKAERTAEEPHPGRKAGGSVGRNTKGWSEKNRKQFMDRMMKRRNRTQHG